MTRRHRLERLLDHGPVRRRDHPDLRATIARAVRDGAITAVLPGVYLRAGSAGQQDDLLRAAMLWQPDAVVTGRLAAAHQFWPELAHDTIDLAIARQRTVRPAAFRLTRRTIPAELVGRYRRIRMTRPALTAVDLCPELGPEVIDRALRSRKVTPGALRRALELCPHRDGNTARRAELLDARGNPWSYAERLSHRLLRGAAITGWRGNPKLWIRGQVYYPDILFDGIRLVVEIDGLHHARDDEVYQNDLWRMNDFTLAGYHMLRYTLADVERRPRMVIHEVRELQRSLSHATRASRG